MSNDDRITELLLVWEEHQQVGAQISAQELCKDCPELLPELEQALKKLQRQSPLLNVFFDEAGMESSTQITATDGPAPVMGKAGADVFTAVSQTIGDYEILAQIAHGGMGVVYKAKHKQLGRVVALKLIRAGQFAGPDAVRRFLVEAATAAKLDHPNIVPVYEVGEWQGRHFLSMAFVEGKSLRGIAGAAPLPPKEAAELMATVAEAVHYAHENGIIHRDIKPENILLDRNRQPRVTDFGLAKNLAEDSSLTATGQVMGTPSYMAPEQAGGETERIGPISDVYSLGATLYFLVTARPPFQAATNLETLRQVMDKEAVSPRLLNPAVPRDLETICLKCLRKDPERRYQSAQELAADLRRWLDNKPIVARPVGKIEKAWLWCKRRPAVAALLLAIAVLLGIGTFVAIEGSARIQADGLVKRLKSAKIEEVPGIIKEIEGNRRLSNPLLQAAHTKATNEKDAKTLLHTSLALLPVDDTQLDYLYRRLLSASPPETLVIVNALHPHKEKLIKRLWPIALKPNAERKGESLRAAVALASFDPADSNWQMASDNIAKQMVAENPIFLNAWIDGLRPKKAVLRDSLVEIFQQRGVTTAAERMIATRILMDYNRKRPKSLAKLLLPADTHQFALLYPLVEKHRDETAPILHAELQRVLIPVWEDESHTLRNEPPNLLKQEIEKAEGIFSERFAICQKMLLADFQKVVQELEPYGYRPIRFRPYRSDGEIRVAAVWTRDGLAWQLAHDLTSQEISVRVRNLRSKGFDPVDVCGYSGSVGVRYAVLWSRPKKKRPAIIEVRLTSDKLKVPYLQGKDRTGFWPAACTHLVTPDNAVEYATVWALKPLLFDAIANVYTGPQNGFAEEKHRHELQIDVCVSPRAKPAKFPPKFDAVVQTAVWHGVSGKTSISIRGLTPREHLEKCKSLIDRGFRPASISVATVIERKGNELCEKLTTASVWHCPSIPHHQKDRLAKRQANAAAALIKMNKATKVWPLLKHSRDPRARSYIIDRLQPLAVNAQSLWQQLWREKDVSIRRALLLGLGDFDAAFLSKKELEPLFDLYRSDPDPGIHGAVGWLLKRWGQEGRLKEVDMELAAGNGAGRRWFVNSQGQCFAVIPGPVEFLMGAPPEEEGRLAQEVDQRERRHPRRIGRSFAIAMHSVTINQLRKSDKLYRENKRLAKSPDCPAATVSWYQAVAYCDWLNKRENIPPDQWCYEPNKHGKFEEGMTVKRNFWELQGYRLPTEGEWEFACRAGAETSRYYGDTKELLHKYAWFVENSRTKELLPVGRLKPNDLGLFDMHGNVLDWCHDRFIEHYPKAYHCVEDPNVGEATKRKADPRGVISPASSPNAVMETLKNGDQRIARGGSFGREHQFVRCACREAFSPENAPLNVSFRLARTMPPPNQKERPGD